MDAPGVVHHVMVRGIDGQKIFFDDDDRHNLVGRLSRHIPEAGVHCFAWALMENHAHFVLQTGPIPIWRTMKRINTGFAIYFNRRHGRRGYLFQDRFKSRRVEGDEDLLGVTRYVHLNPLVGGVVRSLAELERYPWSGYSVLTGARPPRPFESAAVLALFGDDPAAARPRLRKFMGQSEPCETPPGWSPDPAAEAERLFETPPEKGLNPDLDLLTCQVCRHFSVHIDSLRLGRRLQPVSRARAVISYLAVVTLGLEGVQVARALRVRPSCVSRALDRGREIAVAEGLVGPHGLHPELALKAGLAAGQQSNS